MVAMFVQHHERISARKKHQNRRFNCEFTTICDSINFGGIRKSFKITVCLSLPRYTFVQNFI